MSEETKQPEIFRDLVLRTPFGGDRDQARWLWDIRRQNYHRFRDSGFPNRRMEDWRFVNLEPVLKTPYIQSACLPLSYYGEEDLRRHFIPDEKNRVVFVNGNYSEKFTYLKGLPRGVQVRELSGMLTGRTTKLRGYLAKSDKTETDPFAWINTFSFKHGAFIYIPKKMRLEEPIHILFAGYQESEAATVCYPRVVVALDDGAKAQLIFDYAGLDGGERLSASVCEISLGRRAGLEAVWLEREGRNAHLFINSRCRLSRDSRLEMMAFTRGGAAVREEVRVEMEGAGGHCSLNGLALLSESSRVHRQISVNHRSPGCVSRQYFKTILGGQAHSDLNSLVHVLRDAPASDSNQLDRNLLLSDSARGFSRPQLKIDTDDVKCTHGSATGRLLEEELFYLRSRGLNPQLARYVLTYGFAEEILERVGVAPVREELKRLVRCQLEGMLEMRGPTGEGPC